MSQNSLKRGGKCLTCPSKYQKMWCGGVGDSTLQVMVWVDPASTNTSLSPSIMARGTEQDKNKYTDKKENDFPHI
jgi:hypothetical protein